MLECSDISAECTVFIFRVSVDQVDAEVEVGKKECVGMLQEIWPV